MWHTASCHLLAALLVNMAKWPALDNAYEVWLFPTQCGQRLANDALDLVGCKGWSLVGGAAKQWKKFGFLRKRHVLCYLLTLESFSSVFHLGGSHWRHTEGLLSVRHTHITVLTIYSEYSSVSLTYMAEAQWGRHIILHWIASKWWPGKAPGNERSLSSCIQGLGSSACWAGLQPRCSSQESDAAYLFIFEGGTLWHGRQALGFVHDVPQCSLLQESPDRQTSKDLHSTS